MSDEFPAFPIDPSLRRVAIVTGSRAEFGLLRTVMHGVAQEDGLLLMVIAAGSHLISPALTFYDVKRDFAIADTVPMQIAGREGRAEDVDSVSRGISRFNRAFAKLSPDWVVVLGDRIEAFAAASAASIGGLAVCHIHGGDRAEGVADEAMRHAITKLAHLHFAATEQSRDRIIRMGEDPSRVHNVGSPAVDELAGIQPLGDPEYQELGSPRAVVLLHPIGRHDEAEEWAATTLLEGVKRAGLLDKTIALHPNHDPGRRGVLRGLEAGLSKDRLHTHLQRVRFVGLLKRVANEGGVMIGNSSAGLIEAAAIGLPVVDVGDRQSGRERASNAVHAVDGDAEAIATAIMKARAIDRSTITHPYGDGTTGRRCAKLLAQVDPRAAGFLRKHNAY
jgi:UDP-hydrolysing UDP-N-acetyl-D-glucosamine 2-epimerase